MIIAVLGRLGNVVLVWHSVRERDILMLMNGLGEDNKDFFTTADSAAATVSVVSGDATQGPVPDGVSWSASEYIQHDKGVFWYVAVFLVIVAIAAGGLFLTRDYFTPSAIVVLGVILMIVGSRKPRTIQYGVNMHGISIGNRKYSFDEFQSFSIVSEGPIESVVLIPLKRWSPAMNLYFSPDDGQKIFDVLSNFLPFEQREKDVIDKFLHKIRF